MRVLHFYKTAYPDTVGGVEQVIRQIATGASELGVRTDVLALATSSPESRSLDFGAYRLHFAHTDFQIASTGFSLEALRQFKRLARDADLIHFHFPWPFMDMVHFIAQANKPTLVTYHSDIVRQKKLLHLYRPLMRRFLGSMGRIVATSPNYLATSTVLQSLADKVDIIPIGLDRALYPPASPEKLAAWRQRLGPRFFLFIGVLRYYKGLHFLLEAARGTPYPIVIAGTGPIEEELKAQAKRLQLTNITFTGHCSEEDKVALLTLCEATVFPSHLRSEAFGISLLEGAMFGKPMISCEIGTGTTYINIDGETGIAIPPADPPALRQAMQRLWDNPQLAAAMGQRAEARYWQHFTAKRMVGAYVDLYRTLCSGAR